MIYLSNKEKKKISQLFNFEISKKDILYKKKIENYFIYFLNDKKFLIEKDKLLFFHLNFLNEKISYKKIFVDNGAVSFVLKGANIMKPGIVDFDMTIEKNDLVQIENKMFPKVLAVGISLFSSSEIENLKKDVIIKNLHYLKDKYFN